MALKLSRDKVASLGAQCAVAKASGRHDGGCTFTDMDHAFEQPSAESAEVDAVEPKVSPNEFPRLPGDAGIMLAHMVPVLIGEGPSFREDCGREALGECTD